MSLDFGMTNYDVINGDRIEFELQIKNTIVEQFKVHFIQHCYRKFENLTAWC